MPKKHELETTPAWVAPFLLSLARTGVVRHAAAVAGIGPDRVYKRRRRNPAFAAAVEAALTRLAITECFYYPMGG